MFATVRTAGVHVDGKTEAGWFVFLAPSAERETRGRL